MRIGEFLRDVWQTYTGVGNMPEFRSPTPSELEKIQQHRPVNATGEPMIRVPDNEASEISSFINQGH